MSEPGKRQNDIDTIAAEWVARMGAAPLTDTEQRDLDHWLVQDVSHKAAFDEAQSAWRLMGQLRAAPGALANDIVPADPRSNTVITPARRHARTRGWAQAAAIAACLLLVVGGARFWLGDPMILLTADQYTAPGQHHAVTLADGTIVDLGPASAIKLHFSGTERRVELLSGIAYFTVAPVKGAEHRPFVVEAADGTAQALGTQFMVDRLPDAVDVTVTEHRVAVTRAGPEPSRVVVSSGQTVRYSKAGLGPVRTIDVALATAWQQGKLIFDHQPLGDVVAELNRYRRGRIVITDPALASRTVSGVFDTADPDAALATIARELHIRTASLPPLVTLLY